MDAESWAALGVLVGLVVVFFLARRRGRQSFNAAISAARADAAATAAAEVRAQLAQFVNVSVPVNFPPPGSSPSELSGRPEGWTHEQLRALGAAHYHDTADDDHADDLASLVGPFDDLGGDSRLAAHRADWARLAGPLDRMPGGGGRGPGR